MLHSPFHALMAMFATRVELAAAATNTDRFSTATHWNEAYSQGEYGDSYEWYDISWSELRPHLNDVVPDNGTHSIDVLVSGCGNSPNSAAMAEAGFARRLVSVDFSSSVIDAMRQMHPELEWVLSDVRKLNEFDDDSFDLIFDKGALDAARGSKDIEVSRAVFAAYQRVLRPSGSLVLVTSCMEEECMPLLQEKFSQIGTVRLQKKDLEEKREKMKLFGFKFEIREFDLLYIAGSMPHAADKSPGSKGEL